MYQFTITVDKNRVSGSHADFAFMFTEGCASVPAGFWTHVADANGLDIRFYDSDGTTELKREIVLYDSGNQKVQAWVRIPSLSDAADKVIYCRYGGGTRANDYDMWTYGRVYHFENLMDSVTGADAVNTGATANASAKIGGDYSYGGDGDIINCGSDSGIIPGTGDFSVSAWVYLPNSSQRSIITGKSELSGDYTRYLVWQCDNTGNNPGKRLMWEMRSSTSSKRVLCTDNDVADGAYHHIVCTANSVSDAMKIYIDGSEASATLIENAGSWPDVNNTDDLIAGDYGGGGVAFSGNVDEMRVIKSLLSSAYILTEYNNQGSPSSFCSCSAETEMVPLPSVSDSVTVAENVEILFDPIVIDVSDSVAVSEDVGAARDELDVSVVDNASVTDEPVVWIIPRIVVPTTPALCPPGYTHRISPPWSSSPSRWTPDSMTLSGSSWTKSPDPSAGNGLYVTNALPVENLEWWVEYQWRNSYAGTTSYILAGSWLLNCKWTPLLPVSDFGCGHYTWFGAGGMIGWKTGGAQYAYTPSFSQTAPGGTMNTTLFHCKIGNDTGGNIYDSVLLELETYSGVDGTWNAAYSNPLNVYILPPINFNTEATLGIAAGGWGNSTVANCNIEILKCAIFSQYGLEGGRKYNFMPFMPRHV